MTKKFTASGVISISLAYAIKNEVSNSRVQAIYKYENGVSYPPLDKFLAMMELYDAQWQDVAYGPRGDISWDQQMYRRREKPLAVFEIQGNRREEHFKALADRLAKWMYDRTGNNP